MVQGPNVYGPIDQEPIQNILRSIVRVTNKHQVFKCDDEDPDPARILLPLPHGQIHKGNRTKLYQINSCSNQLLREAMEAKKSKSCGHFPDKEKKTFWVARQ